jgi:hypothetical protein
MRLFVVAVAAKSNVGARSFPDANHCLILDLISVRLLRVLAPEMVVLFSVRVHSRKPSQEPVIIEEMSYNSAV